jgi:hypothetical protein
MSRLVGSGLAVCAVFGACSATALAGPIRSKVIVSSKTLKPGVVFTHLRITVKGAWGVQNVYKLSWPIGNRHVRLHSSLLGTYNASSGFIVDHGISHLASAGAPAGMIAAMTGDYSVYEGWSPVTSRTSGMLVQNRQVFRIGAGGPAVGYQPDGRFIMGTPMVRPAKIELPGGKDVTVGALNPGPFTLKAIRGDQVAVYTAGSQLAIPTGYVGLLLQSTALQTDLHGTSTYVNPRGVNKSETVVAFRFTEPTAALRTASMPIVKSSACATNVCQPGEIPVVPKGDVLAVAKSGTPIPPAKTGSNPVAAVALENVAKVPNPAVVTTIDSVGWGSVTDVTGGKPELVSNGSAITARPSFVDPWQWDCGGGCWRPALVRSGNRGWLIVMGGASGTGLTMPQFAGVLRTLGASDAMGFDNNNSAEMWRPGHRAITGYGYERLLPTATTLSYRG